MKSLEIFRLQYGTPEHALIILHAWHLQRRQPSALGTQDVDDIIRQKVFDIHSTTPCPLF